MSPDDGALFLFFLGLYKNNLRGFFLVLLPFHKLKETNKKDKLAEIILGKVSLICNNSEITGMMETVLLKSTQANMASVWFIWPF